MSLFSKNELEKIEQTVVKLEKRTDAEIVTVHARQSDSYYYLPTLLAAVLAILIPSILSLTPFWLETHEILTIQVITFIVLSILLRLRVILSRLIPKTTRELRSSLMARYQFMEQNLHTTEKNLGVLIFVSELERHVEILVDNGVANKIEDKVWQTHIHSLVQQIKRGNACEGLIECINAIGDVLIIEFPITRNKNELCNKLILI